jgi:hypothetical protein
MVQLTNVSIYTYIWFNINIHIIDLSRSDGIEILGAEGPSKLASSNRCTVVHPASCAAQASFRATRDGEPPPKSGISQKIQEKNRDSLLPLRQFALSRVI